MANVITFNCPSCNTSHTVSIEHAGKAMACKNCQNRMSIPRPQSAPVAAVVGGAKSETSGRLASAPSKGTSQRTAAAGQPQRPASSGAAPAQRPASSGAAPAQRPASSGASPAQKTPSSGATSARKPASNSARSLVPGGGAAPRPASNSARSLGANPTKPPSSTPQSVAQPRPAPPPPRTTAPEIPAAMDLAPLMDSAPNLMKAPEPLPGIDMDMPVAGAQPMFGAAPAPRPAPPSPPPAQPAQPAGSASSFGNNPSPEESDVKMNAGDQVLRKSPSGRSDDANTKFVRSVQRVAVGASSSGRVGHASVAGVKPVAPGPVVSIKPPVAGNTPPPLQAPLEAAPPAQSKTGLIVAAVVVVVLVVAVGGAAAAGVFSPKAGPVNVDNAANNKVANVSKDGKHQPGKEETERDKIFKEFADGRPGAPALYDLFVRAQKANLSDDDLRRIGRPAARKLIDSRSDNVPLVSTFELSQVLGKLGLMTEAEGLNQMLLEEVREFEGGKPNELYTRVRKVLGFDKFDFLELYEKLRRYADDDIEGIEPLRQEAQTIDARGQGGWVKAADIKTLERIAADADKLKAAHDQFLKDNPFIQYCVEAFKRFTTESVGMRGRWTFMPCEPYVVFVQLGDREEKAKALDRVLPLKTAMLKAGEHFEEYWRKPLNLQRTWPKDKPQAERDKTPFEMLVFANSPHYNLWFNTSRATTWANNVGVEPDTFRLGMVMPQDFYNDTGKGLMKEVLYQTYSYAFARYRVSNSTDPEPDPHMGWCRLPFIRSSLFFLLVPAIKISNVDVHHGIPMSFNNGFMRALFFGQGNPWAVDANGNITGVGRQILTAREVVNMRRQTQVIQTIQGIIADMPNVTAEQARVLALRNWGSLYSYYTCGLMTFLHWYNESEGGEPYIYREGLRKYIGMELRGEIDGLENPAEAFARCFNLDAAGWVKLEERFKSWMAEAHANWPK